MRLRFAAPASSSLLVVCVALAACTAPRVPASSAVHDANVAMPGPGPISRAKRATSADAACSGCHLEVARTWRGSLHAQAATDPVYERAFAREPAAFCRNCHAPEGERDAGIGCVTCHDPRGSGDVLAAPGETPTRAPHAITRNAGFANDAACAGCHEFAFPDVVARGNDGARMQRTIVEHGASRFADRTCASCHMPKIGGSVRAHGFGAAGDTAMLKRALVVRAARREGRRLVLDLEPGDVGHAFPTGDLFRRLLVTAEATAGDFVIVGHAEKPLGRRFRFEAKVQREIADERVDRPRRIELDLGERADDATIAWRIEYQRVEAMHEERAVVADSVVIASGTLGRDR